MDNASAYGAEDCRFDPCLDRFFLKIDWKNEPEHLEELLRFLREIFWLPNPNSIIFKTFFGQLKMKCF